MQMIKLLDPVSSYAAVENYWWMHHDLPYNHWNKKGLVMPKKKWNEWLHANFAPIQVSYETKNKKEKFVVDNWNGGMGKDFLIQVSYGIQTKKELHLDVNLYFSEDLTPKAKLVAEEILKMAVHKAEKSTVYMMVQETSGLALRSFDINIPELDIELNYGKEWEEKHEYLLSALAKETKKGIALLHGLPGTGKSMYIRYLISILADDRTMIYLPNQLISSITDPQFLPLMAEYPNSVLIIEDAEEAIKSRKQGGHTVDKILNLSDGIISDFLGTQIICTFNNDISAIDEALLRKGRLILKHEFGRLDINQAQKLSDKLGKGTTITKPMTLSEVYNQDELYSEDMKERSSIGFRR
jgi:hypothetical protein